MIQCEMLRIILKQEVAAEGTEQWSCCRAACRQPGINTCSGVCFTDGVFIWWAACWFEVYLSVQMESWAAIIRLMWVKFRKYCLILILLLQLQLHLNSSHVIQPAVLTRDQHSVSWCFNIYISILWVWPFKGRPAWSNRKPFCCRISDVRLSDSCIWTVHIQRPQNVTAVSQ